MYLLSSGLFNDELCSSDASTNTLHAKRFLLLDTSWEHIFQEKILTHLTLRLTKKNINHYEQHGTRG
jgi:hypothetical protein